MLYPKDKIVKKHLFKKIESRGNRMHRRNEIERKEALSLFNYQNAVQYFNSQGIRGAEDREKIQFYRERIWHYQSHLSS